MKIKSLEAEQTAAQKDAERTSKLEEENATLKGMIAKLSRWQRAAARAAVAAASTSRPDLRTTERMAAK